ncbi:hypothetical protein JOC85_003116 [Bacillus mesophilus]|nr:hypothetical protein [Bacillus mesophilus]
MKSLRKPLIIVTLVLIWIYISWRLFYTLPTGIALLPGLLLLGSELILSIQNTLFYILLYKPNKRVTPLKKKRIRLIYL